MQEHILHCLDHQIQHMQLNADEDEIVADIFDDVSYCYKRRRRRPPPYPHHHNCFCC